MVIIIVGDHRLHVQNAYLLHIFCMPRLRYTTIVIALWFISLTYYKATVVSQPHRHVLVREPAIGLLKWLRPKDLKVCYYVEKCAEFKNQTLKNLAGTQKCYAQRNTPGIRQYLKVALKWGIHVGL